ncbi:MAG: hypothetical protein PHR42_00740 [Caldisericia bacterium]|nr:hypothetical protein [Caldisericia bacterium]
MLYITLCFSSISPTRNLLSGDSKHSIRSSWSRTPCNVYFLTFHGITATTQA